jgi:Flp pilus assembly pilin Flp
LFDPTINYGLILTAISLIVAGTAAFFTMKTELQSVDQRAWRKSK